MDKVRMNGGLYRMVSRRRARKLRKRGEIVRWVHELNSYMWVVKRFRSPFMPHGFIVMRYDDEGCPLYYAGPFSLEPVLNRYVRIFADQADALITANRLNVSEFEWENPAHIVEVQHHWKIVKEEA